MWGSSSAARNRPLEDGKSYQVLTSDGKTIVCYHSPKQVPFSETKVGLCSMHCRGVSNDRDQGWAVQHAACIVGGVSNDRIA